MWGRLENFWNNYEVGYSSFFGELYYILPKKGTTIFDPRHLVFHIEPQPYVEVRKRIGYRIHSKVVFEVRVSHIWYGIQCMFKLWECPQWTCSERILKVWREIMNPLCSTPIQVVDHLYCADGPQDPTVRQLA